MTKSSTEIQLEEIQESSDPHRDATSTDSALRYSAYANRIRQIFLAAQRYVAYTSDIGESFRPVAHPRLVTLGYGISWAYVLGDVSYETWRARLRQEGSYYPGLKPWDAKPPPNLQAAAQYDDFDWKVVGVKRALFQSIASMGLPALTIHSTVRYTAGLFKNATNATVRSMGPVACGLAVVPLLPYVFDKPVEHGIDYLFDSFVPKAVKLE